MGVVNLCVFIPVCDSISSCFIKLTHFLYKFPLNLVLFSFRGGTNIIPIFIIIIGNKVHIAVCFIGILFVAR